MRTACCIMSYGITKGMKSFGPIGSLKKNQKSKELIIQQIENIRKIFGTIDIYIIVGFGDEKIKKVLASKKNIKFIKNDRYGTCNYGYAVKLFLNHIKNSIDKYHGVFFIDNNILIKQLHNKRKNESWLVVYEGKKNQTKEKDFLGINTHDKNLKYLFYNMGKTSWCKSFYLTRHDLNVMIAYMNEYYDHMFLFEILNKSIEKLNIRIKINNIKSHKDYIEINGIKDKNKIK